MARISIKSLMDSALWYQRTRRKLIETYGESADLMADLIAATSPQRAIRENLRLAEGVFDCLVLGLEWHGITGILPRAHIPNIERAIRREPLSGMKVRAFAANLKGDLSMFTIDSILWRHFRGSEWITPRRYEKLAARLTKSAKRHKLQPAEYQAILWVKIRLKSPRPRLGGRLSMFE